MHLLRASFVLLLITVSPPASLYAIFDAEDEDYNIEMTGSLRLMSAFLHYPRLPASVDLKDEGIGTGVIRLILDGEWSDYWSFELNAYADLSRVPDSMHPRYRPGANWQRSRGQVGRLWQADQGCTCGGIPLPLPGSATKPGLRLEYCPLGSVN